MFDNRVSPSSTCGTVATCSSVTPPKFTRCRFPAGPPVPCPVCGETAVHHHFGGVVSCNACAAFYRRTIVEHKNYKCRRRFTSESCVLKKVKGKTMCKFCRFRKCLEIGMIFQAVESKRSPTVEKREISSPLQSLVKCFQSNFTARYKATIEVYGGTANFQSKANSEKTADSMLKANNAEAHVLKSFLHSSGILAEEDKTNGFLPLILNSSLMSWITCESLYANIKQLSFRTNRCYFLDDSFISLNEENVLDYYRQYNLLYPKEVTLNAMIFYQKVRELAEKMHAGRVDEVEMAVCTLILILKHAISLSGPNRRFYEEKLNGLFKDLNDHYKSNYECVPTRMGSLFLYLEELMGSVAQLRDEMVILMQLNDANNQANVGTHHFLWFNAIQAASRSEILQRQVGWL